MGALDTPSPTELVLIDRSRSGGGGVGVRVSAESDPGLPNSQGILEKSPQQPSESIAKDPFM